jgi:hypothetical protein
MRTSYVFRDGVGFVDKKTGDRMPGLDPKWKPVAPMIMKDIEAHVAPGGVYVGGRASQRELAKTHGLLPYERVGAMQTAPRGKYDPKCDKWKGWLKGQRDTAAVKAGLDPESQKKEKAVREHIARTRKAAS